MGGSFHTCQFSELFFSLPHASLPFHKMLLKMCTSITFKDCENLKATTMVISLPFKVGDCVCSDRSVERPEGCIAVGLDLEGQYKIKWDGEKVTKEYSRSLNHIGKVKAASSQESTKETSKKIAKKSTKKKERGEEGGMKQGKRQKEGGRDGN